MAKINSICEALGFNLTDEQINKLGYDGYEAFDKLSSINGKARNPNQSLVNLLSDEHYSTENFYQHREHKKNPQSNLSKLEWLKKEQEDSGYTNMYPNYNYRATFPFEFNYNQYKGMSIADVPLKASQSSKITRIFNGAIVPAYIDSENETELPYTFFEWFVGSEANYVGLNTKVNSYSKVMFNLINTINPNFVITDIRKESNNFIMSVTEFINNHQTLNDMIQDNAIGIILDDSHDKTEFQTALTTWDNLPDSGKSVDKFMTDIQNKYTYYIYWKSDTIILIPGSATYLDIDKRTSTREYPITYGYLGMSAIDYSKVYNSRLGQAGFHPRFLTKLLHSQVVMLEPKTTTQPELPSKTPFDIKITRTTFTPNNNTSTLTITLGKVTQTGVPDVPDILQSVSEVGGNKLNLTKVNDLEYTISFKDTSADSETTLCVSIVEGNLMTEPKLTNITLRFLVDALEKDDGSITVIGGGRRKRGKPTWIFTPPGDSNWGSVTDGTIRKMIHTELYNNSGKYGNIPGAVIIARRLEDDFTFIEYNDLWGVIDYGAGERIVPKGNLSQKELLVQYNYITNTIAIYEEDIDVSQETNFLDYKNVIAENVVFEDYDYQEGDELKYILADCTYRAAPDEVRSVKYVKRKHFKATSILPSLPKVESSQGVELVNLKALGTITEETTNNPNENIIYLTVGATKIKLGSYDPLATQKKFMTDYLPIEWEVDDIPYLKKEGINDEIKGMFFIPGENWLTDPTDVYAPTWVQNPGIFGTLEGKVQIGDTYYRVTSLEEGFPSLLYRTDVTDWIKEVKIKDYEIAPLQEYPYQTPVGKFSFGDIPNNTIQVEYKNFHPRVSKIITEIHVGYRTKRTTDTTGYRTGLHQTFIHNHVGDTSEYSLTSDKFNRDTYPSEPLHTIGSNSDGTPIEEMTAIDDIYFSVKYVSLRLPYQTMSDFIDINKIYDTLGNVKEVPNANP